MPLFNLQIEKELNGEFWVNRYIVELDDLTQAVLIGNTITGFELAVHLDVVTFTKYRVSDIDPATDAFVIVPIGQQGQRAIGANQYLPLWNVFRVDFPAGVGRPSRKYVRGPVLESDSVNGVLEPATVAFMNANYGTPLGDLPEFVDVDGTGLGTGITQANVAMRQLRRGSRRRTTPILP